MSLYTCYTPNDKVLLFHQLSPAPMYIIFNMKQRMVDSGESCDSGVIVMCDHYMIVWLSWDDVFVMIVMWS